MNSKHRHAALICAKANNMDLIVLYKHRNGNWYKRENINKTNFNPLIEYFLCLPKHEEACLHWLKGGATQEKGFNAEDADRYWSDVDEAEANWSEDHIFMDKVSDTRIKKERVKRWIVYNKEEDRLASSRLFETEDDATMRFGHYIHLQYIEIDVEAE